MTQLPDPDLQAAFYANVPLKRGLAWGIDMAIIAVMCLGVVLLTGFVTLLIFPLLLLGVGFFYRVLTLAQRSATWGMRVFAIELRTQEGQRFDSSTAVLHSLGYSVCVSFPLLQVISAILMLTDARGQGLTDKVLGTVAINRRSAL